VAINERVHSLEDAVFAAMDAVERHAGLRAATEIVPVALTMFAAQIAWHETLATEEDFVNEARRCFQKIAIAHAGCRRRTQGQPAHGAPVHGARRDDLN